MKLLTTTIHFQARWELPEDSEAYPNDPKLSWDPRMARDPSRVARIIGLRGLGKFEKELSVIFSFLMMKTVYQTIRGFHLRNLFLWRPFGVWIILSMS